MADIRWGGFRVLWDGLFAFWGKSDIRDITVEVLSPVLRTNSIIETPTSDATSINFISPHIWPISITEPEKEEGTDFNLVYNPMISLLSAEVKGPSITIEPIDSTISVGDLDIRRRFLLEDPLIDREK